MHHLSNDLGSTKRIYYYSLLLSILTSLLIINPIIDLFKEWITLEVWIEYLLVFIELPSVVGLYELYNRLFDKYIWKYNFIRLFGLPKIPNLNGKWKATIKSSYKKTEKSGDVTIHHNYSNFSLILKTDESKSHTTMSSLTLKDPINRKITWTYMCEPLPNSNNKLHTHCGTNHLEILDGEKELRGSYYSGRDRRNIGEFFLKKIE